MNFVTYFGIIIAVFSFLICFPIVKFLRFVYNNNNNNNTTTTTTIMLLRFEDLAVSCTIIIIMLLRFEDLVVSCFSCFGRVMKNIDAARLAIESLSNVLKLIMIQRMKRGSSILQMVDLLLKSLMMWILM